MKFYLLSAVTVALLAGTLRIAAWSDMRSSEPLRHPLASIDREITDWVGTDDPPLPITQERSLKATSYLSRTYRRRLETLSLFIAYYANPRAGESMHSPKNCLPGSGWEVLHQDVVPLRIEGGSVPVNRYIVQRNADRNLVLYWYQSRDRIVASEYHAKYWLIRDSLLSAHVADSIVRIVLPNRAAALQDGMRFAADLIPQVRRCIASGSPTNDVHANVFLFR